MSADDDLLASLVQPVPETTIPGTVRSEPAGPVHVDRAPKGWEPGYKIAADGTMVVHSAPQIVNVQQDRSAWRRMVEDLGLSIPDGWSVRLVEAKYDPVAWTRDTPGQEKAVTRPAWRYRFAVEPDGGKVHRDDVAALVREAMRAKRARPAAKVGQRRSLNVVYADPQAGKVAVLGGTRELAARVAGCFDQLEDHVRDLRKVGRGPTEAAWLDGGDCVEGFQNVRSQAFTNDLTMTQQVRAHRRFTFEGLRWLAGRFPDVTAATCGSNHARVREGKDPVGPPDDDWGIEVLTQVQDAFGLNPDSFGHVRFAYPEPWRDTVSVDLGGLVVGLAHGHQFNRPEQAPRWWEGQVFGGQPVEAAQVLVTGHFHHFAAKEVGAGRLWVQAPTLDNGSDWFTQRSGQASKPGLLVFSTTEDGWDDLRILRAD